jgi:hypothetical protein
MREAQGARRRLPSNIFMRFDMRFERLAAVGALGVCGGVLVTYVALAWLGVPTAPSGSPGGTGGINSTTRYVLWVSALVPTALFVLSHLVFARQLTRGATSLND